MNKAYKQESFENDNPGNIISKNTRH